MESSCNDRPVGKPEIWGLTLLCVVLMLIAPTCRAQSKSISVCGHSTVADAYGPEFTSKANSFLAKLQRIVRADDKAEFAAVVRYLIHIFKGKKDTEISTPAEFVRKYRLIVTPGLKTMILTQDPKCLFANCQGVMIGNGELWFQEEQKDVMKVITINSMNR